MTQAFQAGGTRGISFVMDGTFNQEAGDYTLLTFGTMSLAQKDFESHKRLDDAYAPVHSLRPFGLATSKSEAGAAYVCVMESSKVQRMRSVVCF
jgi:hypothetical protein